MFRELPTYLVHVYLVLDSVAAHDREDGYSSEHGGQAVYYGDPHGVLEEVCFGRVIRGEGDTRSKSWKGDICLLTW